MYMYTFIYKRNCTSGSNVLAYLVQKPSFGNLTGIRTIILEISM